jgi:hypothetical protein
MGSLVTSGGGKDPEEEVAPCAPLGRGVASAGALVPAGAVEVGVGAGVGVGVGRGATGTAV